MKPTVIHERVELARKDTYEKTICRLPSGWAVMGDVQFLKGYSLLYPDPVVDHLNAFPSFDARNEFLRDMALLGEAVLEVTKAVRINYEMLGNVEPALHAHVFPRYADEPEELRTKPVWFYDWNAAPKFDPVAHRGLQTAIHDTLIQKYRELGIELPSR